MKSATRYAPEVKERAVRLVFEHTHEYRQAVDSHSIDRR